MNIERHCTALFSKRYRCVFWLAACIALANCSHQHLTTPADTEHLGTLTHWRLEAKLGVRTEDEAHSANLIWKNSSDDYTIELFGPFGKGKVRIIKRGKQITLRSQDTHRASNSARTLLREATGFDVPIQHLKYWIKGLPAPNKRVTQREFDTGSLVAFKQDGWQVRSSRYTAIAPYTLPTKIVMQNNDVKVTLVIKKWQVSPPPEPDQDTGERQDKFDTNN